MGTKVPIFAILFILVEFLRRSVGIFYRHVVERMSHISHAGLNIFAAESVTLRKLFFCEYLARFNAASVLIYFIYFFLCHLATDQLRMPIPSLKFKSLSILFDTLSQSSTVSVRSFALSVTRNETDLLPSPIFSPR